MIVPPAVSTPEWVLSLAGATTLDPWREFRPFTWFHAAMSGSLLLACLLVSLLARRWSGTPREVAFGAFWGGVIISRQAIEVVWFLLPAQFTWQTSLPLQFCDMAPWVAAIALLTRRRWARVLLYYWGIGLCTQAFITPTTTLGLVHTRFWWFWIGHTHIVGSAIYDIVARGFRPTWRDFRTGLGLTIVVGLVLIAFDAVTTLNYGYVGPATPDVVTIVDFMGPYPWRLLVMVTVVAVNFLVLTAVWRPGRVREAFASQPPNA